jgi:hypothetical protein
LQNPLRPLRLFFLPQRTPRVAQSKEGYINKKLNFDLNKELIHKSLLSLKAYIEKEEYKGWDPYDGLNSKVFQSIPLLKNWDLARLAWIQFFKRNPVNLRRLFLVPKEYNPKGIALLLSGYCNLLKYYRLTKNTYYGDDPELLQKINILSEKLISLRSPFTTKNAACWGYIFDWQSKAFFLPSNTPTIVATSFAIESLLQTYSLTKNEICLQNALSAADFIKFDLNRIRKGDNFMFSYSPLDHRAVYNATLLATKSLSHLHKFNKDPEFKELAFTSARAVCNLQNLDGSFPHSDQVGNKWRDNFHTAFKLESLAYYQKYCSENTFNVNIEKGFDYWFNNFFDYDSGLSYYYEHNSKLIDLHCAAQAIPTFCALNKFKEHQLFLSKVLVWVINNMQHPSGYFYYQKRGKRINKIPYMRWPNAWMFYGISYYLLADAENEKD